MSIKSVMPSNYLILCHPLLLPPSIFPIIQVFSSESALHIRWPEYWSFSFSISPSNEYSGLISFRVDWLDLLVVQGAVKSLLQYHSSKASILRCSAFFIVQPSHPYMTTGKTIALTIQTFVSKIMSPPFNRLSRLVIAFLPRNMHLLISWLQSPYSVITLILVIFLYKGLNFLSQNHSRSSYRALTFLINWIKKWGQRVWVTWKKIATNTYHTCTFKGDCQLRVKNNTKESPK